jgi:hypothetical protein
MLIANGFTKEQLAHLVACMHSSEVTATRTTHPYTMSVLLSFVGNG